MIVRTPTAAKDLLDVNTLVDLSINFNAVMYVCRDVRDIANFGSLQWLKGWDDSQDFNVVYEEFKRDPPNGAYYPSEKKCKVSHNTHIINPLLTNLTNLGCSKSSSPQPRRTNGAG
tara:strand:+ start:542 stop:889 length:348 start_codon:yes stop_codon:yes gene_type:complete